MAGGRAGHHSSVTDGAEANWRRIIEAFDRHGVEYLIVGGVGARLSD